MDRRWLIPLVLAVTLPAAYVVQYGWTFPSFQLKPTATAPALPEPTDYKLTRDLPYAKVEGLPETFTSLDVYAPLNAEACPVVVLAHSGRWGGDKSAFIMSTNAPRWLTRQGIVLVGINYRLPPTDVHPAATQDVAAAVAWVHKNIASYGGDPNRITLAGMGMGAHFMALAVVDPQYLQAAGAPPEAISGVVGINGTSYDVAAAVNTMDDRRRQMAYAYFGYDESTYGAASPSKLITPGRKLPPFLLIYSADRTSPMEQARLLGDAIAAAGGAADVQPAENDSYRGLYMSLGQEHDRTTQAIEEFLRKAWPELKAAEEEEIPPYDPLPGEAPPATVP